MQHISTPEQWRPVVGYESKYEVSDHGRVRSVARTVHRPHSGPYKVSSRVLRPRVAHHGHHTVTLFGATKKDRKHHYVHRLVLAAFVGPCPAGMNGCHNDGVPENNHVSNLRWDTQSENARDRVRHGNDPNKNKTHCPSGHPYSIENTYRAPSKPSGRVCRQCSANSNKRSKARMKAQRQAA